jgi:SpoVK/Ycf46/Vps4 family AAA+-type ATPase
MSDKSYFEFKSLNFAANLLEHKSRILKEERLHIPNLMAAIRLRLDPDEVPLFVEDLLQLPSMERSCKIDLESFRDTNESISRSAICPVMEKSSTAAAGILTKWLRLLASRQNSYDGSDFKLRMDSMGQSLGLTHPECDVLELIHFYQQEIGMFEEALRDEAIWSRRNFEGNLAPLLGIDKEMALRLMGSNSAILRLGLVKKSNDFMGIQLHVDTRKFLIGDCDTADYKEALFEKSCLDMDNAPPSIDIRDQSLVKSMLLSDSGCNILLHGEPGTGKSTLAKYMCRSLGIDLISVKSSQDGNQDSRITNLLCAMLVGQKGTPKVVMVDEADDMLATRHSWMLRGQRSDKGWLNKTLETSNSKIIWITNSIDGIERETLRRFSLSIAFKPQSRKERFQVWKTQIERHPNLAANISDSDILEFSDRFPVQAGQIADTVRHISGLKIDESDVKSLMERCLESQHHRVGSSEGVRSEVRVNPCHNHSLDGLNADNNLSMVLKTLHTFSERLANDGHRSSLTNMNVLLSGPPGTGKTEFAKFAAKNLGRKLIVKTASDLQSKWVGQTEKNIAQAFDEASQEESVLLIDEADSFLWSRDHAVRSFEVSQVNEFLSQMEKFRGILVCATNFMDQFDNASLRRFNFKIKFDWLTPSGILIFFEQYLKELVPDQTMTNSQRKRLTSIRGLAPGDFKVTYQRNLFMIESELTIDFLLDELESETKYKRGNFHRQIGFAVT